MLNDLKQKLDSLNEAKLAKLQLKAESLPPIDSSPQEPSPKVRTVSVEVFDVPPQVIRVVQAMEKWDDVVQLLPSIVDRLSTLRKLHEESADVTEALSSLQREQNAIETLLQSDKLQLEKVATSGTQESSSFNIVQLEDAMSRNLENIAQNVQALDARIQALTS